MSGPVKRHVRLSADADAWLRRAWPTHRNADGTGLARNPSEYLDSLVLQHRARVERRASSGTRRVVAVRRAPRGTATSREIPRTPDVAAAQNRDIPRDPAVVAADADRHLRLVEMLRTMGAAVERILDLYVDMDREVRALAEAAPPSAAPVPEPEAVADVVARAVARAEAAREPGMPKQKGGFTRTVTRRPQVEATGPLPPAAVDEYVAILKRNGRPMSAREIAEQSKVAQERYRDMKHAQAGVFGALDTHGARHGVVRTAHPSGNRKAFAWWFAS